MTPKEAPAAQMPSLSFEVEKENQIQFVGCAENDSGGEEDARGDSSRRKRSACSRCICEHMRRNRRMSV